MKKLIILLLASTTLHLHSAPPKFAEGVKVDRWVEVTSNQKGRPKVELSDNVSAHENLVYDQVGKKKLSLDLYQPKGKGPFPCAVLLHGGGWANGNKESFRPMAAELAKKGFVAVTIEYRLSGEARFPGAVEDAKQAIRWLRSHCKDYHIDPNRIGGVGGSAGGHLIGMLATTSHTDSFDRDPDSKVSCAVQCAVMMGSGVDQVTRSKEAKKPIQNCVVFFGGTFQEVPEVYKAASPITHLSTQTPPLLMIEGEFDSPGERYPAFRAKLDKLGVPNELIIIQGAKHGQWGAHPWFHPFTDEIASYLERTMK